MTRQITDSRLTLWGRCAQSPLQHRLVPASEVKTDGHLLSGLGFSGYLGDLEKRGTTGTVWGQVADLAS